MPEGARRDLCGLISIDSHLFDEFVCSRIKTWAPVRKCQSLTWKSTGKHVNHKVDQNLVELKGDGSLLACLLAVANSTRNQLGRRCGQDPSFLLMDKCHIFQKKSDIMTIIVSLLSESRLRVKQETLSGRLRDTASSGPAHN